MNGRWNWRKLGIAAFAAAMLVAGCGGQSNGGQAGGGSAEGSGDAAGETAKAEKVELTMQAWGNPEEIKVYQRALDAFTEKNPNITVKLVPVPGDQYEQKLLTQLQGSQGPDVFYAYEPTIPKLIEADQIQPLTEFLSSPESYVAAGDFPDGLWGPAKRDGELYAVTPDANPMVMYYNKKVFQEAGVKTPQEYYDEGNWNWDAFRQVTSELKAAGKEGYILENWWAHWYSWIWSNGGQMFDDQGNFVLSGDEKAKEAIAFLEQLIQDGNAVYAGSLPKGQGTDAMFMSNQVGILAAGRWLEPLFTKNESLEFDYIYWPSNTGKNEPVGVPVAYFAVNKNSEHVEEAMKFVSFYVSAEGQEIRLADGGNAMAAIAAADEAIMSTATVEHSEFLSEARSNGRTHGSPQAYDAQFPGLTSEIGEQFDLMMLGKQSAADTVAKLEEIVSSYIKK